MKQQDQEELSWSSQPKPQLLGGRTLVMKSSIQAGALDVRFSQKRSELKVELPTFYKKQPQRTTSILLIWGYKRKEVRKHTYLSLPPQGPRQFLRLAFFLVQTYSPCGILSSLSYKTARVDRHRAQYPIHRKPFRTDRLELGWLYAHSLPVIPLLFTLSLIDTGKSLIYKLCVLFRHKNETTNAFNQTQPQVRKTRVRQIGSRRLDSSSLFPYDQSSPHKAKHFLSYLPIQSSALFKSCEQLENPLPQVPSLEAKMQGLMRSRALCELKRTAFIAHQLTFQSASLSDYLFFRA